MRAAKSLKDEGFEPERSANNPKAKALTGEAGAGCAGSAKAGRRE
jgi:hypothetical protein